MKKPKDIVGNKYGRLVVLSRNGKAVECRCDCGAVVTVGFSNLLYGNTKSCGCLRRELVTGKNTTHGMTGTVEYHSWFAMIQRCTNPNHQYWADYGGKGITVCERWLSSFENFLKDMGERPEGKTLDRKKVAGNYEKDNCRWATAVEQQRNKTNNVVLSYGGVSKTASEWADELGVPRPTIYDRVRKGWPVKEVLYGRS